MKHQGIFFIVIVLATMTLACNSNNQESDGLDAILTIENPSAFGRNDVIVSLDPDKIAALIGKDQEYAFSVPFQYNDQNQDGKSDQLLLLFNLDANEKKEHSLKDLKTDKSPGFTKRTQAEISHKIKGEWKEREYMGGEFSNVQHLKVPAAHTDHSWYIRYEGPGWESDKVGYRFYLDWRNATDIFGKKTSEMVLQDVGQDGFDSYHEPSDWGMDVLKVGSSLGIGSIAMWVDEKAERVAITDSLESLVLSNGNIKSAIRTFYYGWMINDQKINLISDLSIEAGSRLTHHQISMDENVENLCTGIVKLEQSELITKVQEGASGWGYLATFGQQSLANDQLGMAVFFRNSDLIELTEDEHSHVVVLKPKYKKMDYYFTAAWEQEKDGITSKEAFVQYLDLKLAELNDPVLVSLDSQ